MTTPDSPLDRKDLKVEEELTMAEKISRLEHTMENGYNQLAKYMHEVELKLQQEAYALQLELAKTLHNMNMSTLQNIVVARELIRSLVDKGIVVHSELEKAITDELVKALEAQQKVMIEAQAEQETEQKSA